MDSSVYQRPNKPLFKTVSRRQEAPAMARPKRHTVTTVHTSTECHVTPLPTAQLMVDYFYDLRAEDKILEPHFGTGNLISALLDDGIDPNQITGIERATALHTLTRERFTDSEELTLINSCFLEYAANANNTRYNRIIMNPPFRKVKQHMNAAISLLDVHRAQLIALVPITYDHPKMDTLEVLPNTTFDHIKINTKLISIEN